MNLDFSSYEKALRSLQRVLIGEMFAVVVGEDLC
jgi:hypothetical protein